ncbi:helix-turn-helix transcriptional regulator [Balneatrix alpica]|uniref:LuxR C-terminal-related transcriptional regulator n=1 Tax=Balneatrix alpica TaxID=75684 RepID=A0ABV5ZIK4_9GAMM|nr:helix-turn-helix transcriptional regulator [Balneatrix alpica]
MPHRNDPLLHIHAKARYLTPTEFKRWALQHACGQLQADKAAWIEGDTRSGIRVHCASLYQLSPQYPDDFLLSLAQRIQAPYLEWLLNHPGQCIQLNAIMPLAELGQSPIYHSFYRKHGIEDAVAMIMPSGETPLTTLLILYASQAQFGPAHAERLQLLGHHYCSALQTCLLMSLLRLGQLQRMDKRVALVDSQGCIHQMSDAFRQTTALLNKEDESQLHPQLQQRLHLKNWRLAPWHCRFQDLGDDLYLVECQLDELPLTPGERQVAVELARGASYKEVAKTLQISPSTVSKHANHIYTKLQIKHKAELVRLFPQLSQSNN